MRKTFLLCWICLFISIVTLSGCSDKVDSKENSENQNVVRIGYQKNGPLIILKSLGTLEKSLKPHGYTVEWKEFQAGPALTEALNAGSIDFGRTGNAPPIFAQASGAPFTYAVAGKSKYKGSGILVPKDSSIQTVADLKGKTIGFAKGSSSHFLLISALEKVGLTYEDITPAFLSPGDARVAFEQEKIDAMVVWDPFTSSSEIHSNAKLLIDGEGLTTDRDFFIANDDFINDNPDIIDLIIEEIAKAADWANQHHDELVTMLALILNVDETSVEIMVKRREYGLDDITEEIIQEQQEIADTFFELEIIPKRINVEEKMKK